MWARRDFMRSSYEFGENFVGYQDATVREPHPRSLALGQAVLDHAVDHAGEVVTRLERHALAQTQAQKPFFAARVGRDAFGERKSRDVFRRGFGILPARRAIEGVRVRAETQRMSRTEATSRFKSVSRARWWWIRAQAS